MTQPPDERDPLADRTPEPGAPEDQPTIAWSPGGSSNEPAPTEPVPTEPVPTTPTPPEPTPAEPAWPGAQPPSPLPPAAGESAWPSGPSPSDASMPPAAGTPVGGPPPPPPPSSPIISASPSGVAPAPTGWQQPAPAGPVVAWETPGAAVSAPGAAGYVIAGMGARLVAFLLDWVIVLIVPSILSIVVVDWASLFEQIIEQAGRTTTTSTFTMEITPQLILVTLIGLALEFIYFIGFWTSGGQATPGMRGLKMKVVDAATGGTLSLTAATKRWVALGWPLGLLAIVPALQSINGVAQFALLLFLFFTAITNDRRQGLHDKWANSLVIRSTTSGDGATVVGCLLLIVIVVGFTIIAVSVLFAAMAPQMQEIINAMESARPTP
jgi:uncharacterized RDD family membrane protein YckC